ncbi:co-chaperone protein p23-1-like [Physcomitrium patens]|uniref:co-chaperone protein p23-1-like n=1 Tax=Physcomitrium patens TaxID=3218 RepID=UPI003CCD3E36
MSVSFSLPQSIGNDIHENWRQRAVLRILRQWVSITTFEADLELYGAINVEKSVVNTEQRRTTLVLAKKETGWWPRLLKAGGKPPKFVKVDWTMWVDEDEENEVPENNFDMGRMRGTDEVQEDLPEEDEEEDMELPAQET